MKTYENLPQRNIKPIHKHAAVQKLGVQKRVNHVRLEKILSNRLLFAKSGLIHPRADLPKFGQSPTSPRSPTGQITSLATPCKGRPRPARGSAKRLCRARDLGSAARGQQIGTRQFLLSVAVAWQSQPKFNCPKSILTLS